MFHWHPEKPLLLHFCLHSVLFTTSWRQLQHDEINFKSASRIIDNLDPKKCMVKIGSVSFNSSGHELIFYAAEKGFEIFLDLKLHDIPNTVKKSIEGLAVLPIKLLTIHASGGKDMMKAAMEGVSGSDIKVFGVTALTSLSDNDTNEIYRRSATEQVNAMLDAPITSEEIIQTAKRMKSTSKSECGIPLPVLMMVIFSMIKMSPILVIFV